MKYISKITLWSLLIWLLLCNSMQATTLPHLSAAAVTDHTDLSMSYLGMVFGHVGSIIQGISGNMLGVMVHKFNDGVLLVSAILLAYTTVLTMMRSAHDSIFTAQNRTMATLVGRMAIGFGLLIPLPSSNYNVMQLIVMKVVKESVVLADMTWDYTLDYLQTGGQIFQNPSTIASPQQAAVTNPAYINKVAYDPDAKLQSPFSVANKVNLSLIQRMFTDEVCMYQSQLTPPVPAKAPDSSAVIYNTGVAANLAPFLYNQSIIFPYTADDHTGSVCGSIDAQQYFNNTIKKQDSANSYPQIKSSILPQLLLNTAQTVAPAAKDYVCTIAGNRSKPFCSGVNDVGTDMSVQAASSFFNAYINYTYGALSLQRTVGAKIGGTNHKTDFIKEAKAQGWAMAGSYYWNLNQFAAQKKAAPDLSPYVSSADVKLAPYFLNDSAPCQDVKTTQPVLYAICNLGSATNFLANTKTALASNIADYKAKFNNATASNTAAANGGGSVTNNKSSRLDYTGLEASIDSGSTVIASVAPMYLVWIITTVNSIINIIHLMTSFTGDLGVNPILFLYHIGDECMNVGASIFFGSIISALVTAIGTIFLQSELNLSAANEVMTAWVKPLVYAVSGMFIFSGLFFTYFLPLYPYFVFIFGFIGWLIIIIEAVIAMPLVALGLTHPEGHEILGKSDQAVMLLLGVFLRPVLMIMGLVIAVVLSFVSYRMVIYCFGALLQGLFQAHAPTTIATAGNAVAAGVATQLNFGFDGSFWGSLLQLLVVTPILFMIFCSLIYAVTTKCYQLIFILPDSVLNWIGAPQQPDGGTERRVGQLERTTSSALQVQGSALSATSNATTQQQPPSGSKISGKGK